MPLLSAERNLRFFPGFSKQREPSEKSEAKVFLT